MTIRKVARDRLAPATTNRAQELLVADTRPLGAVGLG